MINLGREQEKLAAVVKDLVKEGFTEEAHKLIEAALPPSHYMESYIHHLAEGHHLEVKTVSSLTSTKEKPALSVSILHHPNKNRVDAFLRDAEDDYLITDKKFQNGIVSLTVTAKGLSCSSSDLRNKQAQSRVLLDLGLAGPAVTAVLAAVAEDLVVGEEQG
jgi:hypothetical protein